MEQLRSDLRLNIKSILPHLSEEKTDGLIDFLIGKGVKKELDLRRITAPALEENLKDMVDASDLHDEWQLRYGSSQSSAQHEASYRSSRPLQRQASVMQCQPSTSGEGSGTIQPSNQQRMPLAKRLMQDTMPHYDKDSHVMPTDVQYAIANKQRPSAYARCQMVSRIVDDCRQKVPNLLRAMFNPVALRIVLAYPESFRDTIALNEHGSDSLAKQLRDKFDNDRRPNKPTPKEKEAPGIKQAYGCVQWNPPIPDKVTEEFLEDKRIALKEMYSLTPKEWEWKLIKKYMEGSYYLQRKDINGALAASAAASKQKSRKRKRNKENEENEGSQEANNDVNENVSIKDIKDRWPFLFTCRGMNYHCCLLTGTDIRDSLFTFIQEDGNLLIEFLACKGEEQSRIKIDMVRAERNNFINTKLPTVLRMLCKAFKDDISLLVRFAESTTSMEEVTTSVTLPSGGTPIIIAAGANLYECKKFYVCIDNTPVVATLTLMDAFGLLFSAYFALHISYPALLTGLLNFTQRIIVKINPLKGTKATTAAADKATKDKVCKLHNRFVEYKQRIDSLEVY